MATQEDAMLLVQLMRWGNEMGLEEAFQTIFGPDFDPEAASNNPAIGKVLTYGEAIGTFVKHDLLDGELVRDLIWVEGIWERVRTHALAVREEEHEPRLYENFEALVARSATAAAH
jgi:hypothetical protein